MGLISSTGIKVQRFKDQVQWAKIRPVCAVVKRIGFRVKPQMRTQLCHLLAALGQVTVTTLHFPHHFNECHSCFACRIVWRIKWDTAWNSLSRCLTHNKKEVNVSCDYSSWPCSPWIFCMAPGTKHPVEQTITEQMHLRCNLKQPTTSHSSPNVLSLCPASPSVPILQAK